MTSSPRSAWSIPASGPLRHLRIGCRRPTDGGGFYAGPPDHDVSHEELVSTVADYARFLRALSGGAEFGDGPLVSAELLKLMTSDQIPGALKRPDSFFPGIWDQMGWGFGVGVQTGGDHAGRFGWSGGLGTDFFVDPDGTIGILLAQVDLDEQVMALFNEFQQLVPPH